MWSRQKDTYEVAPQALNLCASGGSDDADGEHEGEEADEDEGCLLESDGAGRGSVMPQIRAGGGVGSSSVTAAVGRMSPPPHGLPLPPSSHFHAMRMPLPPLPPSAAARGSLRGSAARATMGEIHGFPPPNPSRIAHPPRPTGSTPAQLVVPRREGPLSATGSGHEQQLHLGRMGTPSAPSFASATRLTDSGELSGFDSVDSSRYPSPTPRLHSRLAGKNGGGRRRGGLGGGGGTEDEDEDADSLAGGGSTILGTADSIADLRSLRGGSAAGHGPDVEHGTWGDPEEGPPTVGR